MTLEQLEALLDAYGPIPEEWPDTVRDAAERLVAGSPTARALWDRAVELERLLRAIPAESPSPALRARVLAAAPRPRPLSRWRRRAAVVVPLAAAAAVVLWIAVGRELPRRAELATVAVGEYTSPTDVLLQPYGVDVYASVPSVGCSDSTLGCPGTRAADEPTSLRASSRRSFA